MVKWWAKGLGLSAGILMVVSIAYAQFSVPTSNSVLSGVLLSSNEVLVHFKIREGAMLTLRDEEQGFWYGLIPQIDPKTKGVRFRGVELTPRLGEYPDVREVLRYLDTPIGKQVPVPSPMGDYSISIQIEGVEEGDFPTIPPLKNPHGMNPQSLQKIYGASGGGLCSLTCGSMTVTSTSVRMPCGVCEGAR
jgi:hypothetical protein